MRSTKAELQLSLSDAHWMPDLVRSKLVERNARLVAQDRIIVKSQVHRTQEENRKACVKKLQMLVDEANLAAHGIESTSERKRMKIRKAKERSRRRNRNKMQTEKTCISMNSSEKEDKNGTD
ncbi:uncharacterized protein LOC126316427 [Schistocerca gregaria]|uniref:uncharacterized protein LOC126316427 n=1 Tax=Schistocerca gregaria TaxID=7010 RepID=UPI00211DBF43|nr:uncharacterized protein LOC126316427 [Schistocerca gregaria]